MEPPHAIGLQTLSTEYDDVDIDVEGALPEWLDGTLYRNGGGRFEVGGERLNHWFDALALLRRFRIDGPNDRVRFSATFLRSEEYASVVERGRLARGQFGTVATDSWLRYLWRMLRGGLTDNASVSVDRRSTEPDLLAITETPRGVAFDPKTLATTEHVDRARGLDVTGVLGHAHEDPFEGELVNVGTRIGRSSEYVVYSQTRGEQPAPIARFEVDRPAYVHSFGLTERYAVVFESPFRLDPTALLRPRPFVEGFDWNDARDARFVVVDRRTGDVVAAPATEPAFVFHHANAYEGGGGDGGRSADEDEDALVVDVVAYESSAAVDALYLNSLRSPEPDLLTGQLRRYRVPLDGGRASSRVLHPGPVEFPTTNYRRVNGRPYRYLYAAGNRERPPSELTNRLLKVDVDREAEVANWSREGVFTGEPLFVPEDPVGPEAETASAEDEGVIVTVILDAAAERSELLVLDAGELSELARAPLPTALPFGFHGQFYRVDGDGCRSMA